MILGIAAGGSPPRINRSGVGESIGAAIALSVGASIFTAIGSSAGVASAAAIGSSPATAIGSSAGVASAAAIGKSTAASVGAATGVATVEGQVAFADMGMGEAVGAASVAGVGASLFTGVGNSSGVGSAAGVDASTFTMTGVGSSSGVATVAAVGRQIVGGVGSSTGVATVAAVGTTVPPLDPYTTNLTCAISLSRKLLSAYTANSGSFYGLTSGNISTIFDQSGGASAQSTHDFTDAGTSNRRAILTTAGNNSRACAQNNNTSTIRLATSAALSAFIANNAGWVIISAYVDAVTLNNTNAATPYLNDILFGDHSQFMGLYLRNNGPTAHAYNFDTNADDSNAAFSTGAAVIFEWRHDSGNVILTVNGTDASSTASGNTGTMTGVLDLLGRGNQPCSAKVFELAIKSAVPGSTERAAIRNNFASWVG
jgi:hypothetical protein